MNTPARDIAANFLAAYSWFQRTDPELTAQPVGNMLCCHTPGELTDFNVALPDPEQTLPDPSSASFRETLRLVRIFFQARSFSFWIQQGSQAAPDARDLGFSGRVKYTSQYLELKHNAIAPFISFSGLNGALTVRRVTTPGELEAFSDLVAAGWKLESGPYRRFFTRRASRLFTVDCPKQLYIGWIDQAPICCMELFVQPDSGVAGIYYVATHAAYRRQGHALSMQLRILEQTRLAGFRAVVVISEPAEQRIMARLGFVDQGPWHEYIQNAQVSMETE